MSGPKFTPGPWSFGPATMYRGDIGYAYEVTAGGSAEWDPRDPNDEGTLGSWQLPDGYMRLCTTSDMGPEARCNAALIAAAPELYAALAAIEVILGRERLKDPEGALMVARAALAKARGAQFRAGEVTP